MTRLTNGFSKRWENLEASYSLWFAYYNFCRIHKLCASRLLWRAELQIASGVSRSR
jgi:hypothetical protein